MRLLSALAPDIGISDVLRNTALASMYRSVSAGAASGRCSILIPTLLVVAAMPESDIVLFVPDAVLRCQLLLVVVQTSASNFTVLLSAMVTLSQFTPECNAREDIVSICALN